MLEPPFKQPLQDRPLRRLALIPQLIMHVTAFLLLCCQRLCATQISLIAQDNQKLRLLSIRSVLEDPRSNLAHGSTLILRARLA